MKKTIFLTSASLLAASNLTVQKLRDENRDIFHLSIKSDKKIECVVKKDYELKDSISCTSEGFEDNQSVKNEFELFDLIIENHKIVIKPKYLYDIYGRDKPIYEKRRFFDRRDNDKVVDIFFYKKRPSYISKDSSKGLNFDIEFKGSDDLYIDVLNDDLEPVVSLKDVSKIDFLKKLFKKGDYASLIKKADIDLKDKNLYSSDILLYKIRALDRLLENKNEKEYSYDDLEESSSDFIDRYPSNKHIVEVLYYKVKSLYKKGKYKDATRLVKQLENNFKDDIFTQKAKILKAKNLYQKNKYKAIANKTLKELLYDTKYDEIALESAYILVGNKLKEQDTKSAKRYLEKILNYKEEYLLTDKNTSYRYAKMFAAQNSYKEAAKIAEILAKSSLDDELLKNLSFWQEKANMKEQAYQNYKRYLKEFPNGNSIEFVKERLDKVLLDINDTNSSSKLKNIENILEKYPKDPVYKKALLQKVKLYLSNKEFQKVLELEDKLKDINETKYIDQAAKAVFEGYLAQNDCINSVDMVSRYKIVVNSQRLYKLTRCYYDLARYKEAYELAQKYIKSSNPKDIKKWYEIAIKTATKMKNYNASIALYEDYKKLEGDRDKDILFFVFESYFGLKYIDRAKEILKELEDKNSNDPKLLDLYYRLVKYYKKQNSDLLVVYYGKKLLKLQKELKVQTYSPLVDILVIKSLKNLGEYKKALSLFADAYLSKNINDTQKAQLLYLAGEISLKEKKIKQAREFFIKCGTDVKSQMWQKLCSESLKLIEDK